MHLPSLCTSLLLFAALSVGTLARSTNTKLSSKDVLTSLEGRQGPQGPPPSNKPALMGRYIVNQAEWTSVATISSRKDIESFPFASLVSVSDGPLGNGTGIPYMYLTPLDFTAQDVSRDHRATLMMTLAQGKYCDDKGMDPMDPRCARIILTGEIKEVKADSPELQVAKDAVFGRHPWLAKMPSNHHFFFAKLDIASIVVLAHFGGPSYVPLEEYLHPQNVNYQRNFGFEDFNDLSGYTALRV